MTNILILKESYIKNQILSKIYIIFLINKKKQKKTNRKK
jgi:hypothetical protein